MMFGLQRYLNHRKMSITWEPLVLTLCIIDTQKLINDPRIFTRLLTAESEIFFRQIELFLIILSLASKINLGILNEME